MTAGKCEIVGGWLHGPISIAHHNSPNQNGGMAVPSGVIGVIMHTMVGDLPGCNNEFMNPNAQVSAHFGIDQQGNVIQWVPVNGAVAWAECSANHNFYSIEHADHGNPHNPLTDAQMVASAQIVECLGRFGNFPLDVADTTTTEGYNKHNTGGLAWCGHSCPDFPFPGAPFARSGQRQHILNLAKAIRAGTTPPPPPPPPPVNEPTIQQGSTGAAVRLLQQLLNAHGDSLAVDGDFGPGTKAAVEAFQHLHRLTVDGVVGPATWHVLMVPQSLDPGAKIRDGYYRHTGNGHVSPNQYAAARNTSWRKIVEHSVADASPLTDAHKARLLAFTGLPHSGTKAIPTNVVFYTTNP